MTQVFYEPSSRQVVAIFKGNKYSGTSWGNLSEVEVDDSLPVSRDTKLVFDGKGEVTGVEASPNPADEDKKAAAVAEAARQAGITSNADYMSLVEKAKTASAAQIETYIDNLFSSLSTDQRSFLKALVFIAIVNPQLRG